MTRRAADGLLVVALVGCVLVLVGAASTIVRDPVLAITWWSGCTAICTLAAALRRHSLGTGALFGTVATLLVFAVDALCSLGVPAVVAAGLAATVVVLVITAMVALMGLPKARDYD